MACHIDMVYCMKTTLNIPDPLMQELREEAARRRTTMASLVEAGLRRILADRRRADEAEDLPPLPSWDSGGFLVDITDREALDRLLNAEKDARLYSSRRDE